MRTTLNLNDSLMQTAKKVAAESGSTVTAVIEAALRDYLQVDAQMTPSPLPISKCKDGLQPGVQISSSSELLHDLDVDDARF